MSLFLFAVTLTRRRYAQVEALRYTLYVSVISAGLAALYKQPVGDKADE